VRIPVPRSLEDQSAAILAAVAFLAFPLAYAAPLGLAPLAYVAAALGLGCTLAHRARPLPPPLAILVPLLALGGWAVLSGLWAVDPKAAVAGGARFLAGAVGGAVLFGLAGRLDSRGGRLVRRAFAAGFLLGGLVIALEFATEGLISALVLGNPDWGRREVFWLNRDLAFLTVLVWPFLRLLPMKGAWIVGIFALAALAAAAAGIRYNTALLAIGMGIAGFLATLAVGRRAAAVLATVTAAGAIAAPVLVSQFLDPDRLQAREAVLPNSAYHRAIIWTFATERIAERPVLGWGMAASPRIPGGDEEVATSVAATGAYFVAPLMPLHPHNGPLQVWLELGGVGASLFAAFLFVAIHRSLRWEGDRWARALTAGQFATILGFFSASFGAWQGWWQGALWIAATLMAVVARPQLAVPERT
jgi:O-antigen ligase